MNEKIINFIISVLGATRTQDKSLEYLQACDYAIHCLEAKGKYDRMAPIYNDKESFESALKKAWKFYNKSGSRTVDSCEDNYIECIFSKGFREGFLYKEKQKKKKPILEVFGFRVGDAVRLKDGDGRKHIIKSFEEVEGLHGPNFYHVEFEDDSARDSIYLGEEYPNGYYTQMEKIEEQKSVECNKDERIRKELVEKISNLACGCFISKEQKQNFIAYLEKQKEQKHTLKFKIGDKVHLEGDEINILTITGIEKDRYLTDNSYGPILFEAEDIWQIVEQKEQNPSDIAPNQFNGITYGMQGHSTDIKAPDKIDVNISDIPEWKILVEYICKESLLKWLGAKCHEVIPNERQKAFEEVIDKIKAMSHE